MFDIGWSELMVIGALALIVVGPRDLPKMLRSLGQYVAQARGMAREFQRSMEDAARDADLSQLKEMRDAASELRNLKKMPFDAVLPRQRATPAPGNGGAAPAPATPQAPAAAPPQTAAPAAAAPAQVPAPDDAKSA